MKEPFALETGRIVRSTQGRDRGSHFFVLENLGQDRVLVADGWLHPLSRPKKKNSRHLHATPIVVNLNAIRPEGGKVQDSDLRRSLEENGFPVKPSLCKEG